MAKLRNAGAGGPAVRWRRKLCLDGASSGALPDLSLRVRQPGGRGASQPVFERRQELDHLLPFPGPEALLRQRERAPHLVVLGAAHPLGPEIFPEVGIVLEEALAAGA